MLHLQASSGRCAEIEVGTICIYIDPCILNEAKGAELHLSHLKTLMEKLF